MKEQWKTHSRFTSYSISNRGQVKRIASGRGAVIGKILNQHKNRFGHMIVACSQNGRQFTGLRVHQLVLETFIGHRPSKRYCSNHINGKKYDNQLKNLEWTTYSIKKIKGPWRTHPEFTNYAISDQGQVKRTEIGQGTTVGIILKQHKNKYGYMIVGLCQNGESFMGLRVHQLVLQTFVGPKPSNKHCCNHKNGKKHDNRLVNLEWVTYSENAHHAVKFGLIKSDPNAAYKQLKTGRPPRGEQQVHSKLTEKKVIIIKKILKIMNRTSWTERRTKKGLSHKKIGKVFKVNALAISDISMEKTWKHVKI